MTDLIAATSGRVAGPLSTRVLVVDDSDQLVALLAAWLEDEGYLVATATTGSGALAAAAQQPPDVVLLDLILPPPDGFRLCESLQRGPRPPVIVVMTGLWDPIRMRRLEGLGVFAVLQKPLTQEIVLDAVSRARRRRWQSAQRAGIS